MENKKLIKLSNGNIKEMTCSEVFEQFKNFLYKTAIKWSKGYEVEDIFQVGSVALVKAYNNYSIDKDIKFITYLYTAVKYEIWHYHYKNEKHIGVKSLDSHIVGHSTLLIEMLADDTDYEEIVVSNINKIYIRKFVEDLIKCLNPREQIIIKHKFMDELTLKQIGTSLGISGSRVGQIVDSCLRKMKHYYERKINK
ncbi:sigma-70 family RNA polymerase sigma factor [Clostridium tyrobutyricum]|uniref:sigma-70 family RNA polymerase sigma factor n=1 Tax=Clostridium tyrobutyricum TaxID=1519 RepID=UPI001C393A92|nr:sigma-70 family RNA polymerase sigma factor [Clostridium tyrobutyricum]MBV4417447.1 sigma-70 family RNA polymerase sigma factor [Clostridium tyrobutyricum]